MYQDICVINIKKKQNKKRSELGKKKQRGKSEKPNSLPELGPVKILLTQNKPLTCSVSVSRSMS